LIRLAVRVRREHAELVLAELLALAPGGVEEVDQGEVIEYAVYGPPGEVPALPELRAAAGGALVEVATSEIADDWPERWRDFHRPTVVGGVLTVRAPWHARADAPIEVVIDPGRAFGTGSHATTRLSLELLLSVPAQGAFLDLGSGSGVLAIAAARLGFGPVTALDNDPAAVEATRENAAANAVDIEVRRLDLRAEPVPGAPTVAANLLAPLLLEWGRSLADGTSRVIASGVLAGEAGAVVAAFADSGLHEAARRNDGDWVALLLERTGAAPESWPRGR
jgi:ribosomal protein L11 methyltransferase